jgi:hypothetical protein
LFNLARERWIVSRARHVEIRLRVQRLATGEFALKACNRCEDHGLTGVHPVVGNEHVAGLRIGIYLRYTVKLSKACLEIVLIKPRSVRQVYAYSTRQAVYHAHWPQSR